MAEYLIYGSISYTTTNNKNTAQTQISNVFTNNAANVVAEAVGLLPAGISNPDSQTVAFAYRILNSSTAKNLALQISSAYSSAARKDPMGYIGIVKVTAQ